jgi:hypothetical protein
VIFQDYGVDYLYTQVSGLMTTLVFIVSIFSLWLYLTTAVQIWWMQHRQIGMLHKERVRLKFLAMDSESRGDCAIIDQARSAVVGVSGLRRRSGERVDDGLVKAQKIAHDCYKLMSIVIDHLSYHDEPPKIMGVSIRPHTLNLFYGYVFTACAAVVGKILIQNFQ